MSATAIRRPAPTPSLLRVPIWSLLLGSLLGCPASPSPSGSDPATLDYLETTLWTPSRGGRVACGYEVLGTDDREVETYAWVVCEEFVGEQSVGGLSEPVVLTANTEGVVASHRSPRDGSLYGPDVERLFPRAVRAQFEDQRSPVHEGRVERLSASARARALDVP